MFHKIKNVAAIPDYQLSVQFCEGVTKIYDVKPLFEKLPIFSALKNEEVFFGVTVDVGGYGIIWNDDLDLSCDELWENGIQVDTPFDGLIAFSDATELWGLNESTLRKAVAYGKLVNGGDVWKFGKQWVVSSEAMKREDGAAGQQPVTTRNRFGPRVGGCVLFLSCFRKTEFYGTRGKYDNSVKLRLYNSNGV